MMRAERIIIENERDLVEAQAMIAALGTTEDPGDDAGGLRSRTPADRARDAGRYSRLGHGSARSRPGRHAADLLIGEPERAVA
jgi:hypothetical protein